MNSAYRIVGAFDYLADAEILRVKLESEGIEVFLKDANVLQAEPFIASAIGGVKVMVLENDLDRAKEIYDALRPYAQDNDGNPIICPNCKAARSERYSQRKNLLEKLFPFLEARKYRCLNCGMITRSER